MNTQSEAVCPSVDKECSVFKEQPSGEQVKVGSIQT